MMKQIDVEKLDWEVWKDGKELVIHYGTIGDTGDTEERKKSHDVEDLLNECLGWTRKGACDGEDIGSGTANIFNYVIDVEKATQTILEELKTNNLLNGVKIACLHPEDEKYTTLYPKGAEFNLLLKEH
ncbi:hypothetical protein [Shouchella miscanthi]|uniref:hypothetical protein n=1 Tax=Shouchella miscanthi TaxID=2598861 RepID=UPI003462F0C7